MRDLVIVVCIIVCGISVTQTLPSGMERCLERHALITCQHTLR